MGIHNHLLLLIFILGSFSCGSEDSSNPPPARVDNLDVEAVGNRHNVLVIDDGFDLNHPVFWNKVVSRYKLKCGESDFPMLDPDGDFARQKKQLITYFSLESEQCTLVKNFSFTPSQRLESLQASRDEWNGAIQSKSIASVYAGRMDEAENIFNVLNEGGNYHGTHTAGLIGYNNDRVNLFILQLPLSSPMSLRAQVADAQCPRQSELDFVARMFNDPDVLEAYVNAPLSTISSQESAIQTLVKRHKVTMINKSYGLLPREAVEQSLNAVGCNVDFTGLFSAQARLIDARRQEEGISEDGPLIFQAAGNESLTIDTLEDSWDCTLGSDNTLLIGGISEDYSTAEWSNDGSCVELYAVGDRLITPAPLDFLNISSGTSFASPIALRYATQIAGVEASTSEIKTMVLDKMNGQQQLVNEHFPPELVYQNNQTLVSYRSTKETFFNRLAQRRSKRFQAPFLVEKLFADYFQRN